MLNARLVTTSRANLCRHATKNGLRRYRIDTGQTINEPITPKPQPTVISEDRTTTLRRRQHGGKSLPLPLPPLMDPLAVEAKERYIARKPRRSEGTQTAFQREMETNPFACALATPIRQCQLTSARLPSHFLLPLVASIPQPQAQIQTNSNEPFHQAHLTSDLHSALQADLRSRTRIYVLAHRHILDFLTARSRWPALVTERMKKWVALSTGRQGNEVKVQRDMSWDKSTAEAVLGKMREEVVRLLGEGWRGGCVVARNGPAEKADVACLLALKDGWQEEEGVRTLHDGGTALAAGSGGTKVYDLAHLFGSTGQDPVAEMSVAYTGSADAKCLAVLDSQQTLELRLALMRLEAYIRGADNDR